MASRRPTFGLPDVAQQVMGAVLLAGPFVLTEEVWTIAGVLGPIQWGVTVLVVLAIGWSALYGADEARDPRAEARASRLWIPTRFLSLMLVSVGSVAGLAAVVAAPEAFGADTWTTAKAVSVVSIFSVLGASTADTVFSRREDGGGP